MNFNHIRNIQKKHYRGLCDKYKGTPMSISSESWAHKNLRFQKVTDIMKNDDNFSVHDIGMGFADLFTFMKDRFPTKSFTYSGTEILDEYYEEAKLRYPECSFYLRDVAEKSFEDTYDYLVMSGVFHQRREARIRDWEKFAQEIIKNSFEMCNKGIAFNFISPFVDYYQTEVYYSNIYKFMTFINDELSRFFTIHHDYPLFEYTVFVYKENYIAKKYPQEEFQKYLR